MKTEKRGKVVRYNKWGYIFLIPFILVYLVFQFIPLASTIYNSFFENYRSGLTQIGPNFVGLENYRTIVVNGDLITYAENTLIMWVMGFVPQIIVSLLLAAWFSNPSLRLRGQRFFKTVIYLPNLIMASAFAMLFFTLFADSGPVNGGGSLPALFFLHFPRPGQLHSGADGDTGGALQVHVERVERQNTGRVHELSDVVRQHDDPFDGGDDGDRHGAFRGG